MYVTISLDNTKGNDANKFPTFLTQKFSIYFFRKVISLFTTLAPRMSLVDMFCPLSSQYVI